MLTLILIILAVIGVVLALLFLRAAAMGVFVIFAGAWAGLRAIFKGHEHTESRKAQRMARIYEENNRLAAGEGTLRQIRQRMKAEERARSTR